MKLLVSVMYDNGTIVILDI